MSAHATSPDRSSARPTLLYLVKQLELAIRAALDEVLQPVSLTPLQYTALTVLERRPELSVAELARNSFVTDQSAADMVGALEKAGLLSRRPDPRDRRRRALRLTVAGQGVLDSVRQHVDAVESRMLAPLDSARSEELRRDLELCLVALGTRRPRSVTSTSSEVA